MYVKLHNQIIEISIKIVIADNEEEMWIRWNQAQDLIDSWKYSKLINDLETFNFRRIVDNAAWAFFQAMD